MREQLVLTRVLNQYESLDISGIQDGFYLLETVMADKTFDKKVLKE